VPGATLALMPSATHDVKGDPLAQFSDRTREWFLHTFAEPTPAQIQGWPAIASGDHVLISAPTGSGKTLAAFLWGIDQLLADEPEAAPGTSLVYVSPLKALSYDIERNLRAPLAGIGADLQVAVRTGDTPQRERQAMLRHPPDVLITTPESLYLMLTSRAQALFADTRWCIVDEVHSVASNKRGAHLALTLERMARVAGRDVQRIGLSATQRPLEEVGRFLVGPRRRCRVIDTQMRKPLDLQIRVPVESMTEPAAKDHGDPQGAPTPDSLTAGNENANQSIWPAMYPELLALIRAHRSTIVFVNARRGAERLALRLNELAAAEVQADGQPVHEIARAHHGSLAREERTHVEELLKAGELPCIVATSSLELGIDMGAVDLVIQVESPKSVSRGLQRIGRSGHSVQETSRGRIFPKFRADLLECAVVARLMREGRIEETVVPRNPLDVLAQQIVAVTAAAPDDQPVAIDDLYELVTGTHNYADLSRAQLENVLDMLDGRYPSAEFAELRPRIVWDRVRGRIRARPGARQLAVTNAGTIPDRGLYAVVLPDGRRVGELDEEMVYESRPGQTFLLGAATWRIEQITRDRLVVTPAPGLPAAVPFWKGDGVGRPMELGEAIGGFARWAVNRSPETLERDYALDARAARNLLQFLTEQQAATRVVPSDRTIVVERFRDEIGDFRLCVLSPFGGRLHAAWALALSARIRDELGLECDAIHSDDGIIVHLPDAEEPPDPALALLDPAEVEDRVVAELGSSALFGARFRENASRALLIPRARPGKRTPLWQQRLKAQSLLEVARKYGDFPIVLETYRECLRDVLDVPGLVEVLTRLERGEISLVDVETETASPFASSLLFDYVATYMYEGDAPNAERRAAALSLDRELLRELLGQDELRDLIDPGALVEVERQLQHLTDNARATGRDGLHDVLRKIGDLATEEVAARVLPGLDSSRMLAELKAEGRAVRVCIEGQERFINAADAGLYRDALGVAPPDGLPAIFTAEVPEALIKLVQRYAATHGPFTTGELEQRYGVKCAAVLRELERDGGLVRGELRPGGSEREWCDPAVLRRLRRASLAVLRKEIEPVEDRQLARFLSAWQGVARPGSRVRSAGPERLREVLAPLQGVVLAPAIWEREVLPRRLGAYSPAWMDELCASGELVWIGAGASGRSSARVALYFREDVSLLGPPAAAARSAAPTGPTYDAVRERLSAGACFFSDLLVDAGLDALELQEKLWNLVWSGEVTNDAFAPLRVGRLRLAKAPAPAGPRRRAGTGRFSARRRTGTSPLLQGRWSLTASLFPETRDPSAHRRAVAEVLLERYGILTREHVRAEGVIGGFSALYPELSQMEVLGLARRGYFVEGLGGAQFAVPGAVERLREVDSDDRTPVVLSAVDPAQPYGAVLPWPQGTAAAADGRTARKPARIAGAHVVLSGGDPVLFVERGGRALQTLVPADDPRLEPALVALVEEVRAGRVKRLACERVDGIPALASPLAPLLVELGFREGPRRLIVSA
jgi:ATP-dependent Lhr-like helicase